MVVAAHSTAAATRVAPITLIFFMYILLRRQRLPNCRPRLRRKTTLFAPEFRQPGREGRGGGGKNPTHLGWDLAIASRSTKPLFDESDSSVIIRYARDKVGRA